MPRRGSWKLRLQSLCPGVRRTSNAAAPTVQWSPDLIALGQNNPIYDGPWESDIWYPYHATFTATGSSATLWIRGDQSTGSTSTRIYVDDVEITPGEAATGSTSILLR